METRTERRRHPRYLIPAHIHVAAGIRADGNAYQGKVLNLSAAGFLAATRAGTPPAGPAEWEIGYGGHTFRGRGRLAHRGDGRFCVEPDDAADLKPLIDLVAVSHRPLGAVEGRDNQAAVTGFLDFETARQLQEQIGAGRREIDLSGCQDLNASGLAVLLLAIQAGVRLSGCHGKVLQIFSVAGVCRRCRPGADCACRTALRQEDATG